MRLNSRRNSSIRSGYVASAFPGKIWPERQAQEDATQADYSPTKSCRDAWSGQVDAWEQARDVWIDGPKGVSVTTAALDG